MDTELKDQRVTIMLTPSEYKAVEDWSFANRIRSRGEAIRRLIDAGLRIPTLAADLTARMDEQETSMDKQLLDSAKNLDAALFAHNKKLQEAARINPIEHTWIERLTKNEREVHEALINGATAKDIAAMLGISESTAAWFITGIESLRRS